jgi:hypothetical protein
MAQVDRVMPKKIYFAVTAALLVPGLAGIALAATAVEVDFRTCQQQLEALLRPDVDCIVEIHPGSFSDIPQILQSLLAGATCRLPLRFRKAQVYSEWITDAGARSPDFAITCSLAASGQPQRLSASARVECTRAGPTWSCIPVLHDVNGLGVLGRALENYVNNNAQLRSALTNALSLP